MAILQKAVPILKNAGSKIWKKATTKDPLINKAPIDFIGLGEGTVVKGAVAVKALKSNIGSGLKKVGSIFSKNEGAAAKQTVKTVAVLEEKTAMSTGKSAGTKIAEKLPKVTDILKTGAKAGAIVGVGYGITQIPAGVKSIGGSVVGGIKDIVNPSTVTVESTDKGVRYKFTGDNSFENAAMKELFNRNTPDTISNEQIGHSPSLDDWLAGSEDPVLLSGAADEKKSSLGIAILVSAAAYLAYESSKKKKKK